MKIESNKGEILGMVVFSIICATGIALAFALSGVAKWTLLFVFVTVGCATWGYAIRNNTCNVVRVDQKGIKSKKGFYSWGQAVLTVATVFGHRRWFYRVYFADKALLTKDEQSTAKEKGMYIDLTNKRLAYLLGFYNKQVVFVGEKLKKWYMRLWQRKIDFLIDQHNSKY